MDGHTIVLIEDSRLNTELIIDLLSMSGFKVCAARDAETGIQLVAEQKPDLVLMDIGLPGMDGLEATQVLKANPKTAGIPVVALTSHAMKGDDQIAYNAGCDGYITKPIDTRLFIEQLSEWLPK